MPFQKGNTLWVDSHKSKKENLNRMSEVFFSVIGDGALEEYSNKLDKLARGEELSKAELEFMNRFEGWREYKWPKLERKDIKGEIKNELLVKIELTHE